MEISEALSPVDLHQSPENGDSRCNVSQFFKMRIRFLEGKRISDSRNAIKLETAERFYRGQQFCDESPVSGCLVLLHYLVDILTLHHFRYCFLHHFHGLKGKILNFDGDLTKYPVHESFRTSESG